MHKMVADEVVADFNYIFIDIDIVDLCVFA